MSAVPNPRTPNSRSDWSAVPQNVRARIRKAVFARDGYRCRIGLPGCTGRAEEIDHVVPTSKGGALIELSNVRAACRWCNRTRWLSAEVRRREPW